MTRQLDVDRVLEDWLAEGPSRLPDHAIRATIAQLDDIQQRRSSWLPGSERMTRLILPLAGVAAVLAVAVVALTSLNGGGPGGLAGERFTSQRHAYSVVLADGWTHEERAGTWDLGDFFEANTESGVDYFERIDPADGPPLYLYLSSQPIPAGMTFDEWAALHDAATAEAQPCFARVGSFETATVGGEVARVGVHRCENFGGPLGLAWTTVQTLVAHDGRGYAIYVWPIWKGSAMPSVDDLRAEATDWLYRFEFTK